MSGESIPAKVHPVPPVEIFEVFSTELDAIERSSTAIGTDLQTALVLLPAGLSLTAGLLLSNVPNLKTYIVLVVVTVICWIVGLIFLIRWWPKRKELADTIKNIRSRRLAVPAGEAGKEISSDQLARLQSTEPPPPAGEQGQ